MIAASKFARCATLALAVTLLAGAASAGGAVRSGAPSAPRADVPAAAVNHDVSPPLRTLAPAPTQSHASASLPYRPVPHAHTGATSDAFVQTTPGTAGALTAGSSFDGIGEGFSGPSGGFTVNAAPPDPNAAVGPNDIVEVVNTDFAVFNKTGTVLYGPVPTNTLWSGFGGGCQTNNDGDGSVVYDQISNRWVITQFSVSTTPYLECVAVSATGDPTGAWYRYAFSYGNTDFPDYPKLGVWPDAYYIAFNIFPNASTFSGARVCAYDRAAMLAGQAATQQCFSTSNAWGGLLPATLDGATPPPSGAPDPVVAFGTNSLGIWHFHVDWTTPASSTFSGPSVVAVAAFTDACSDGTCIPQAGTSQQLDSLGDRLMYRLAYRNFGDHEAMVVNHSVTAGSSVGVRWYELRESGAVTSRATSVFQQGTYAPDSSYRWMGSAAFDGAGDIALGYSDSSSTLHPSIRYTARLASDPAGQMTQAEGTIFAGAGSQIGSAVGGLSRWGDYSSLVIDPSDDCTFWYTNEYEATTGAYNWHTRIGSFKLAGCGTLADDFAISSSPASVTAAQGASATSTISTSVTSGSAQSVSLSASGLPAGASASFTPSTVTAGGSSTLTFNVGAATAPGTYTVTVTGTGASATHTTTVDLTVTVANDFSLSATPASVTAAQGGSTTSTISTSVTSGSAQSVSLSASGLPAGASASFTPSTVTAGGSSTLTFNVGSTTAPGTYTVTVTGTGASATHTTTVSLTVQAPADFTLSASPSGATARRGGAATYTISVNALNGFSGRVTLQASGLPSHATATFSPNPATSSSSTLTIATKKSTPVGTVTITITGTAGVVSRTTSVTLTTLK